MHMHEYSTHTHTHTHSLPRAKEKWIERTHCLMVQCSMAALLIMIQTWKYSSNHVVSWCHDVVRWYSAENIKWSLSCWHICCPMFVVLMDRNWEIYGGICNPLKAEGNMRPGKERGRCSREVEVNWRTMIAERGWYHREVGSRKTESSAAKEMKKKMKNAVEKRVNEKCVGVREKK